MRIGLTGVAGFIGINLANNLLMQGHSVVGVDNFYTGSRNAIKTLSKNPRFFFVEHDIRSPFPQNLSIDYMCNLACPASPVHYQKDPLYTIDVSTMGTKNILEYAHSASIPVLHFSTSEVYGNSKETPQSEDYFGNVNCTGPRACYDEGKRLAETLCFDYKRQRGLNVKVVRIFNTYGPHMKQDDGRVISNFVAQALRGNKLSVYGDGTQTRCFCYIDDLVEGLTRYMFLESTHDISGPVNFGSDKEITIVDLTKKIGEHIPNIDIEYKPMPEDDPVQRRPDLSRAKTLISWYPKVDLYAGLQKTIEWMKNNWSKV